MTVGELLERMSAAEFNEWLYLESVEPTGEVRADLRAGIVAAVIANAHSTKGGFTPGDFMPVFGEPEYAERTDEEMRETAMKLNAMFGGERR